jgi:hypothetical protein
LEEGLGLTCLPDWMSLLTSWHPPFLRASVLSLSNSNALYSFLKEALLLSANPRALNLLRKDKFLLPPVPLKTTIRNPANLNNPARYFMPQLCFVYYFFIALPFRVKQLAKSNFKANSLRFFLPLSFFLSSQFDILISQLLGIKPGLILTINIRQINK